MIITTGKYLKREDLTEDGEAYKVISVSRAELTLADGESESKWILQLDGLKPLILNATNIRRCIAAFDTSETEGWIGRKIVAYDDPDIEFGGKMVGGVRLRAVPKKVDSPRTSVKKVAKVADSDEDPIPF
tara:strand:- start:280 stop:669 length:390 start_codon:yes stop_codon:yes gene_type:complete